MIGLSNRLKNETSPYLLQHKDNPVDWYPWGSEAFERARKENKPIFLSIGYSACHWCHVLAHESFEDEEIARLLNEHFISIKVDKEERPDIDSVYMAVCQAFTGGGGWPTSIFMTADGKPFFAGTYFPRTSRGGMIGMQELLLAIHEAWIHERDMLLERSEQILAYLNEAQATGEIADAELTHLAVKQYARIYDKKYGGFGRAPKFPTPHNLLFLLGYYERYKSTPCREMVEHTLLSMYRGGIFDHIGHGFCRYSTDKKFLVPHFEKMLYDNALLILALCKAHTVTKRDIYLEIAEKTASYILREMTSPEGAFYSSQDADSEGEEGKYYLFTPDEIIRVLGREDGDAFNRHFDITDAGNFEGKNIPNLLKSDPHNKAFEPFLQALDAYRKARYSLHRDEKILTVWNSLMIGALCQLYLVSKKEIYLTAARRADRFLEEHLYDGRALYVSYHAGKRGTRGFLDDYAAYSLAQLSLYRATLENAYLERAERLCNLVLSQFRDGGGGFYLYANDQEELILRPKETYDGAIPSGNSLMAFLLTRLSRLTEETSYTVESEAQLDFLKRSAARSPTNHAMLLLALLEEEKPRTRVTAVTDEKAKEHSLALTLPPDIDVILLPQPTKEYPLKHEGTTYYVCRAHSCLPPTNDLNAVIQLCER